MNEPAPMDAAEIAKRKTVTDLYVRLGRLMRENGELRASLRLRDIEIARLQRPSNTGLVQIHSASCTGCALCYAASAGVHLADI